MKHSAVRCLLPKANVGLGTGAALFLVALVLQATACVSSMKYNEVVAERDVMAGTAATLGQRAGKLEVSNASLEAERVQLYDQLEDLRVERESLSVARTALEADVARLEASKARLSEELESTSLALAAASENVRDLQSTFEGLVDDLESELQKGAIEIEQLRTGLRVAVSDEILFQSGSAKIDPGGVKILETVAGHIKQLDYAVDVEGHTDNRRIRGTLAKRYPTNWELAGARASSVVRLFESAGIDGARLQAISRAEHAPVASNDDAAGRSKNRRIEIRLRPRETTELIAGETEDDVSPAPDES